jgi:hypothetical protein
MREMLVYFEIIPPPFFMVVARIREQAAMWTLAGAKAFSM